MMSTTSTGGRIHTSDHGLRRDWGTQNTVPKHIWMHEVELTAIRRGVSAVDVRLCLDLAERWFHAGEPIWMAAESLAYVATQRALRASARAEAAGLRAIVRGAIGGGK